MTPFGKRTTRIASKIDILKLIFGIILSSIRVRVMQDEIANHQTEAAFRKERIARCVAELSLMRIGLENTERRLRDLMAETEWDES